MICKKVFSMFMLVAFLLIYEPFSVAAQAAKSKSSQETPSYKAKVTKTGVNEAARQEAYNEYAASNLDNYIEFHPLFKNGYGQKALKVINNVGGKLLAANNIDKFVRFELSRKQVVNAYANFQGTIRVYNGLLNYVESEDELAFVLGHELGHVFNDDVKKSMIRNGLVIASAVAVGAVVAASSNSTRGGGAAGATALGGGLLSRKVTKRAEARADIRGIDFMTKAGYNPMAAISIMNKIMNRRWDGLSDHPSGDKRLIAAYHYIAKTYPKYLVVGYDTSSYERAMTYIQSQLKKESGTVKTKNKKEVKTINPDDCEEDIENTESNQE